MADSISVRIEGLDALKRTISNIGLNAPKIIARALNDTASHGRTLAVRDITSEWNIKARDVRSTFSIQRAAANRQQAELISRGKPIPLLYFDAKQSGIASFTKTGKRRKVREAGVRYKVKKAAGRELLQRGWINRLKAGRAVGIRRAASRLPITAPAVPGVYHAWRKQWDEEIPKLNAFLLRRVNQLVQLGLERRGQ